MPRHFKFIAVCFAVLMCTSSPLHAATPLHYVTPTLEGMVDLLFANGFIDPTDNAQLVDYVRAKDCGLLQRYYSDDFAWNKIKTRITNEAKILQKDVQTHFFINDELQIERYDFKTQAFNVSRDSQMRNINQISLLGGAFFMCNGQAVNYADRTLPLRYGFMPDVPLSIYRIPMAEGMARRILPDIIERGVNNVQTRTMYVTFYLTVDGVVGIDKSQVVFGGHLDKIEFFSDAERTQRVRTLMYNSF